MRRIDWKPLIDLAEGVILFLLLSGTLAALIVYFATPLSASVGIP